MSQNSWAHVKKSEKSKLYRIHHFLFMSGGFSYNVEIQEDPTGIYTAHADNTSDPHDSIPPQTGKSLDEALGILISTIESRSKSA